MNLLSYLLLVELGEVPLKVELCVPDVTDVLLVDRAEGVAVLLAHALRAPGRARALLALLELLLAGGAAAVVMLVVVVVLETKVDLIRVFSLLRQ